MKTVVLATSLATLLITPALRADSPYMAEPCRVERRGPKPCAPPRETACVTLPPVIHESLYPMPAGYKVVHINGVKYYRYGTSLYFRALGETDRMMYIQTP
jgi:hypothetical protein